MPVINEAAGPTAQGPCAWTLDTGCVPGWDTADPVDRTRATEWATFILDALTGHQFAQCPVTVRPCGSGCGLFNGYTTWPVGSPANGGAGPWMIPYVLNGVWLNCTCAGSCSCLPACRIDLGVPVAEVTEVKVNGLVVDPSAYQLQGAFLVRIDGGECWPSCQDPSVPDTEDGTFAVTYRPGRALPVAGQIAAGKLAGEFLKACAGSACALPAQISSLSRQGVDVEFVDPSTVFENGRTGIPDVDLFITAVNPTGMRRRSRVMSPDVRRGPVVFG